MSGGQVWVSIELVIVDVIAGPSHGSFNDCGISGGLTDIAGLGRSPPEGDAKVDEAGAIRDKALWTGGSLVSSLVCLCSEPIDV